jgi:hypothetical protein
VNKRPLAVTVIAAVYIVTGAAGLAFHLTDFKSAHPLQFDVIGVAFVRLLAIIAGIYMLRGSNWARWLALAWMLFHVVIAALNSWVQCGVHAVFFVVIAYFLLRPEASRYFRGSATSPGRS